jgi:hypothetical protein
MPITLLTSRFRVKTTLLSASFTLFCAAGLFSPAICRADVAVTVDQGQDSSQHGVSTSNGSGGSGGSGGGGGGYGGKGGSGGSSTKSTTQSSSTFFTITLRNTLGTPVKGVEVEYHVYNKTTTTGSGTPSVTVDDITDKVTIDLDGSGSKQIETKDIPHVITNASSGGGGGGGGGGHHKGGGGGGSPATESSTVQDVMGWVIYLNFNGHPKVRTFTSSGDILDQVAKYSNPNGNS